MDAYVEPKIRTVRLRAALAVGAAAVAGAFGGGYVLATALDRTAQATVAETGVVAVHTSSDATADSLALKRRSPLRGKAADIRYRRVR